MNHSAPKARGGYVLIVGLGLLRGLLCLGYLGLKLLIKHEGTSLAFTTRALAIVAFITQGFYSPAVA